MVAVWIPRNRGNSVLGSHSDNPQCCVPECWRANIFSAKHCVNRTSVFFSSFDWADSFLKDFPFKGKHIDISLVALFN